MKHKKTYADMERHPGDMSDFRRPAYSVRHPKDEYDTQNMSIPQQSVAGYPKDEYDDTQNTSTEQQNEAPYIKSEYNTQNTSTGQQNVAKYPESEYDTQDMSMASKLIRAQGEQIRRVTAEEYLIDKIGSEECGIERTLREDA